MDAREIAKQLDAGLITTRRALHNACKSIKYTDVMKCVKKESSRYLLQRKPTRSMSGVSVLALMCAPHDCPGKCVYCPKGDNAPQSYTGLEPAAMRAINNNYDPYKQVIDRLKQYEATAHDSTKIEVVIMGGNFLSTPINYQTDFIKSIYQALNNTKTDNLSELKKENETALHRCVAMTVETRPDVCADSDIKRLLDYGVTRVELGCQSVYDNVLEEVNRGHNVKCVKEAIKRLKDVGLKVDLHVMIGLPGSSAEMDVNMFKILFTDPDFSPDGLKIYPCLIVKGTKLYDDWFAGKYTALTDEKAASIIAQGLEFIPPWVRVKRVMRDIPTTAISAGPKLSNLREVAWAKMIVECNCIRCRETGRKRTAVNPSLSVIDYIASGGREFFISYEDFNTGALVGFARLRLGREAFLRELHVYGKTTPVGLPANDWQHKGYGALLLKEAELIAFANGYKSINVMSGVGVRGYYRKHGYLLEGDFMVKYNN
ncbi:MAG: tRNA uridine(34) 5-carboxymethylaminomethyl modification radical SAM/GNAT enzyme Elp3 [Candidatus Nanoarchaeia archaeon]|jgi:elongator complex protein 3